MTQPALRNFARADEIIRCTEGFYAQAVGAVARRKQAPLVAREAYFVDYLIGSLTSLAQRLTEYRLKHEPSSLITWVQYTPENPIPTGLELASLGDEQASAEAIATGLRNLNQRWIDIFADLCQHAPTEAAAELFDSCRTLLMEWAVALTRAQAQRFEL